MGVEIFDQLFDGIRSDAVGCRLVTILSQFQTKRENFKTSTMPWASCEVWLWRFCDCFCSDVILQRLDKEFIFIYVVDDCNHRSRSAPNSSVSDNRMPYWNTMPKILICGWLLSFVIQVVMKSINTQWHFVCLKYVSFGWTLCDQTEIFMIGVSGRKVVLIGFNEGLDWHKVDDRELSLLISISSS